MGRCWSRGASTTAAPIFPVPSCIRTPRRALGTAAARTTAAPPTAGDDLVFPPGAARLINVNNFAAGTAFNSIAFTEGGYRLTGSNVLLTAGISASHASGVNNVWLPIQLNANQSFTNTGAGSLYLQFETIDLNGRELTFGVDGGDIQVTSAILGTGSVLKIGPGLLSLSISNSYKGT